MTISILRQFGLRQLEWDKTADDVAFGSANAVVDRHNREIESAYLKGFEDARSGALFCVNQWRDWDLRNQGKTAQAIGESINQMTAAKHAEFMNKQRPR